METVKPTTDLSMDGFELNQT